MWLSKTNAHPRWVPGVHPKWSDQQCKDKGETEAQSSGRVDAQIWPAKSLQTRDGWRKAGSHWECVTLSWKTLTMRNRRSNSHLIKGIVAEVGKVGTERTRARERRRDNESMNLASSTSGAYRNWHLDLFNQSLSHCLLLHSRTHHTHICARFTCTHTQICARFTSYSPSHMSSLTWSMMWFLPIHLCTWSIVWKVPSH